jgi:hypothetical protein
MSRLRRRPRAVYRVYDEDEYLAGVDPLPAWEEAEEEPAGELSHGRKLQRLAGAAALTGAVGTVGGVVGLAGLRTHATDPREIAQRVMPPAPTAALPRHASRSVPAVRRRRTLQPPTRPPSQHTLRGTHARIALGSATRAESPVRGITVRTQQASVARYAPAEDHVRTVAQSEFGFER